MNEAKKSDDKVMLVSIAFWIIFGLLFLLARQEGKSKAQEIQIGCARESYEMAAKAGVTPKEYEYECLRQHEEDQLRALDR